MNFGADTAWPHRADISVDKIAAVDSDGRRKALLWHIKHAAARAAAKTHA
jgi:hypothetical protein